MSLEMTLAGGDFLKCLTEILLVDLRDPGSHDLDERFSALERLQDGREVCLETAKQLWSARVPDPHPDDRRAAVEHFANDEVFILGDDDRAAFIA